MRSNRIRSTYQSTNSGSVHEGFRFCNHRCVAGSRRGGRSRDQRAQIAKIVVTANQVDIDAVDKTLIPGAKNEELKALLVKVRPAFIAHLEHAKKLQADLSK